MNELGRRSRRQAGKAREIAVVVVLGGILGACGNSTPTPAISSAPSTSQPAATSSPTLLPSPSPSPTAAPTVFPIAVVSRFDDPRISVTQDVIRAAATAGQLLVPCEVTGLSLGGSPLTLPSAPACHPAEQITAAIHANKTKMLGLLPPGLVTPSVKVLAIGDADLFGSPSRRANYYPLTATTKLSAGWTAYDANDIRTLISTGDTCPDRGVSLMAVKNRKGWNWTLAGGSAHYAGFHMDTSYSGPAGNGWPVPNLRRNGNSNLVGPLIADNDVSANDFECPMVAGWIQHNTGQVFTIDPRVAQLLATKGGLKVVTLGSNHITDAGWDGVRQTIKYLDAAGIKHTGAGANIGAALAPAVVDVRGVKFAFVGWDDIHGSSVATATHPGAAPMDNTTVCKAINAARKVADIVIAMPQWGWPEYHNTITAQQKQQRQLMYDCGADGILGSGTHWASWASILPGPNGPRFAIGSHGNFLFDQNWSQQTMEGVIVEVTFDGTHLAQFRLHPYVVVQGAQPCLLDPTADGKYVLSRVWSVSEVH